MTLSPNMRRVLECASPYKRNDGQTGRLIYAETRTVAALVRRGYATAAERVNNGNSRAILTQRGVDLAARLRKKSGVVEGVAAESSDADGLAGPVEADRRMTPGGGL